MTREELFALRKQSKWERLCRLQERIMPMVYGMGDAFTVSEVDLRPDDRLVYILGSFRDCDAWIRIEQPLGGGPIVPWIELKIVDNPEAVPESCPAALKQLEEEAGVELLFRRAWLSLGTEAHGCKDGEALRSFFDHLLDHVHDAAKILMEGNEAAPFDQKRETIAVPRRDALVN